MTNMELAMQQALELFDQHKYREAFSAFVSVYNQCEDIEERHQIFSMLEEAYYTPNIAELQSNYEKNLQALKEYPYLWKKSFHSYEELSFQLFPVSDEIYYCYDQKQERFLGEYDAKTQNRMRYFFENLDGPIQVKDEDSFYNLTFLNDNVRASEDYAEDNHIYLMYTSLEPLERLMLACDLEPILAQKKFVFLVGEKNWNRYPINFKKEFGIDYSETGPNPIRIEELKRFCLFYGHSYSGITMTRAVLEIANCVQLYKGWEFNTQSMLGAQPLFYTPSFQRAMKDIHRKYTPDQIEDMVQSGRYVLKLKDLGGFLNWLRQRKPSPHEYTVKELFCGYFLFLYEERGLNPRIVPVLLFDPHTGNTNMYNNLILSFPYYSALTSVREPVVTFARFLSYSGLCIGCDEDKTVFWLAYDYCHGQMLNPKLRSHYYGIRFEDMKTRPEAVCRALCRNLNIPYEVQMLEADGSFTDIEGNKIQGFDDKPLHRDVSGLLSEFDQLRLKIFFDPILKYYGYPSFPFEKHPLTDTMVRELFRYPFQLEYVIEEQSNGAIPCEKTHRWLQKMLQGLWKKEIICPKMLPLEEPTNE